MNDNKRKSLLDVNVMRQLEAFEYRFFAWVDNVSKRKFRYLLTQQAILAIGKAKELLLDGLGLSLELYAKDKVRYYELAKSKLFYVQTIFNRLNDVGEMSNVSKAEFDIALDDIQNNLSRLLNSLLKRIDLASQIPQSTEKGETCDVEGCLTADEE